MKTYRKTWQRRIREAEKERKTLYRQACKTARRCSALLKEEFHVDEVYLIGSLLDEGTFDHHSDIDLVIKGLPPKKFIRAYGSCNDLARPELEVDLIPYEDAGDRVQQQTRERGEPL